MMNNNTHVYLGTLPCGCRVAAAVDVVDNKKQTARSVAEMITNGYAVSRHALSEIQNGSVKLARCTHDAQNGK